MKGKSPMTLDLAGRSSKLLNTSKFKSLLLGVALLGCATPGWAQGGTVVAWGDNRTGQGTVPDGLNNVVAIAAGEWHNLALRADGTVLAWGYNAGVPGDLGKVEAIAAGGYHNFALKADGTLRVWGDNTSGQCNVPAGVSNVVAMAGGWQHSIALKSDGTVVGWGRNSEGQATTPGDVRNVVAISSGEYHNLALQADGTVRAWGWNGYGATSVPAGLNNVIAIAGGGLHSLALKADGTVVAWGWNQFGQATVPSGLRDVVAIAGGIEHSLALKADGTVVGWGANDGWASNDPNCQFIGSPCPRKYTGQIDPPAGLNNVVSIKGGVFHSIALRAGNAVPAPSAPVLSVGTVNETSVTLSWSDLGNETGYRLEARVGASGNWTEIATPGANATSYQHTGLTPGTTMFYRLRAFNTAGDSAFSAEVSATTTNVSPVPMAPTLSATVLSHSAVDLTWNDVEHESGYRIERRTDSGEWSEIATPAANATSFSDAGLTHSTTYFYRIRALSTGDNSPFSAEVQARTERLFLPEVPTLSSTGSSHSSVALAWSDVANEDGYRLEVRGSGGEWMELATLEAGVKTFNHTGLSASTDYTYRVRSFNDAGASAYSVELTVKTQQAPVLTALTLDVLGGDREGMRVRVRGEAGQRFKVQQTTDFKSWTDVADSSLESASTEMRLVGGATGGFFRTVNLQ